MTDATTLALKRELLSSPGLFPLDQSPDGQYVHFVRLDEDDYRHASFMDQRMIAESQACGRIFKSGNVPFALLSPWTLELPLRCDFIFHLSHAGSTMLARMLGEHPDCLSLREPWILRSLVNPISDQQLRTYLSLWSRTFRPNQRAMIKATSFVSQIGVELLRLVSDAKAILMVVPAETFLASVLDGSMSDIDSLAASRMARLPTQVSESMGPLDRMSSGERAAMSWFAEMESLKKLHRTYPDRTLMLDFEEFLKDTENQLRLTAKLIGLVGHEAAMLHSPTTKRYAKKLEVPYDANFRKGLLDQSRTKHQTEIRKGLLWIAHAESHLPGPDQSP